MLASNVLPLKGRSSTVPVPGSQPHTLRLAESGSKLRRMLPVHRWTAGVSPLCGSYRTVRQDDETTIDESVYRGLTYIWLEMAPKSRFCEGATPGADEMRELSCGRDGPVLRLCAVAAALTVSSLVVIACASVPAQATDPTSTPTATPVGEQASAEPTDTPTSTATPPASGAQGSGSDTGPTSTPTPTPTPSPSEEETSDLVPPATTTVAVTTTLVVVSAPPLGDCYGGALSEDPIICYVVEQAEAKGRIDVLGVYEGGEGRFPQLYVSISQELTRKVLSFSVVMSRTFYDKWPELVPEEKYGGLTVSTCKAFPSCYLRAIRWDRYRGDRDQTYLLPIPNRYQWVKLVPGGESGRRDVPGWASWRQLWPPVSAQQGAGSPENSGGPAFDVSDVDVTNLPEIDGNVCLREVGNACNLWRRWPGLGLAGAHGGGIAYYQIKNPPTDEAGLEAIRRRVSPCYDVVGPCPYTHEDGSRRIANRTSTSTIEIVPVKYDYRDLWRWAVVLRRFAVSAGNTIGITNAYVLWNQQITGGLVVYPRVFLNGLSPAGDNDHGDKRETIFVVTRGDQQVVVDALPVLLPLLGIPVDAVGVVNRHH